MTMNQYDSNYISIKMVLQLPREEDQPNKVKSN